MKIINIGTLNTQGCQDILKLPSIAKDAERYNVQILALTETHLVNQEIEVIKVEKKRYNVYHNGIEGKNIYSGVGILIEEDIPAVFRRISDRICVAEIYLKETINLYVIVAYAPTLDVSERNPEVREEFYRTLSQVSSKLDKSRHALVTLGDFNAKTGSGYKRYPNNMGRYGKGLINSNGEYLLEYAKGFDLYLTNTTFPHRLSHRTTWTAPERKNALHHDGKDRKKPYRNQIDYILTKTKHKMLVRNSRSYGGFETRTGHKLIIANLELEWWKLEKKVSKIVRIETEISETKQGKKHTKKKFKMKY